MNKSTIISSDDVKKSLPGYHPSKSEEFHRASANIADKMYKDVLKSSSYMKVILTSGGSASGKTEYVSEYLTNLDVIIFDGTLPTPNGAKIKIDKALKYQKSVEVHAILPKDILIAFIVFLNRDRKFSQEHFYRTHSQSRATLLFIAHSYPMVRIKLIHSEYLEMSKGGAMKFTEIIFMDRADQIEFIQNIQYTEKEIRNQITI